MLLHMMQNSFLKAEFYPIAWVFDNSTTAQFFNFTMVQWQYVFSRYHPSDTGFLSFPDFMIYS